MNEFYCAKCEKLRFLLKKTNKLAFFTYYSILRGGGKKIEGFETKSEKAFYFWS